MGAPNENAKIKGIPLKVLILEDRPADAELMLHELRTAGYDPAWQRVETEADYRQHLDPSLEIILADYNLPQFTGLQAIDILIETDLNIPLILVTGTIEETALECLKRGAVDYILKDRSGRLGPAVKKALEDKRIRENNKLAAEALRASEQRYRGVAETALTGLSIVDADENITYSNPAFSEMVGYTNKELLGMSLKNLVDPDDYPQIRVRSDQRNQGLSSQYETKMIRKNGEVRTVIVSASPLTSKDGEYIGSQAVITDITERVRAETKLRENEQHFRAVVETANDAIITIDSQGIIVVGWNQAAQIMFGYSLDEMVDQSLSLIMPKRFAEGHHQGLRRVTSGGEKRIIGSTAQVDGLRKDGSEFPIEISVAEWNSGQEQFYTAIIRDITERVQAEKEKARSRDLLLTLSQVAPTLQSAGNAEEIYKSIGERVVEMGFDVTVFTLSDDRKHLVVSYQSLKKDLIWTIEKLTNLSVENYSFPLKVEGYYHKIITNKETVFNHIDIAPIEEILPRLLRPLANKVMNLVNQQQSIVAPLIVDDEVLGLMAFTSHDLSESDIPAVTTFANQAAIALEKTRLFQETKDLAAFNDSIIRNMAEGIVLQDPDGVISFVNPAAAKMLDYTSEEWIGKHWTEIVPPDQQAIIQKADERRKLGQSDRYELELVNKDSQRISVLVGGSPRFDGEGQFAGTMAVFTDITERKRTEEKISRFSRIFEDSLNEIFLFNPDSLKFTQVNTAGQNNIGYTMEELYELTPFDIKPEVTAKSFEYLIAPLRKNETDRVIFETVHKRKDGSLYNVEVHLQLMRYENEALFAAIIMDITERYQAELESKRYIRRLDALLNIDQAIMGSFDLQVTLNIILEQIQTHLEIDAVAVLSYHEELQTLSFTRGHGFQTPALQYTDLRLGEGYAGEVGLQRDHIFIPDLNQAEGKFRKSPQFSQEEFVSYYGIPLLAKGKLVGVLEIFNRSPLDPEDEWVNYLRLLAGQIAIAIDNISLFNDLQRTNIDLTLSYDATIEGWARALELKDMETEGHSRRVVEVTLALSKRMGISGEKLRHIRRGALLHDIGKMAVPDAILQKPGKLTDEEWQIMKQHPVYAYEWLSRIEYLRPALDIPYAHHERWDGTGYPLGLEGEQIPLAARIFAIVDVWDALNSDRPYRKAWSKEKILDHIREQSGKHFDPSVVDAFVEQVTGK